MVANKIDIEGTGAVLEQLQADLPDHHVQAISAQEGTGVEELIYLLREMHDQNRPEEQEED